RIPPPPANDPDMALLHNARSGNRHSAIPHPKTTKPRQGGVLSMRYLQRSNVEAEVHHVAVLDDVVLAFQAPFAGFLGAGFALVGDEVVIGDHFGADKAFL